MLAIFTLAAAIVAYGQQTETRLNPEMGEEHTDASHQMHVAVKPYINLDANVIRMNGADWSRLRGALESTDSGVVRVLHIGDSHIQAEGATSRVRNILQEHYGNAGRGLIAPLRLAGTNAPTDYTITSSTNFTGSRLLKRPWNTEMGFSGVAVRPARTNFDLNITCGNTFDCIRIYTLGSLLESVKLAPDLLAGYISPTEGITEILLTRPTTSINIGLKSLGTVDVTAFELLSGDNGLLYSAIGNNGATFATYTAIPGFGDAVERLQPDLIVLSLGTNEAFGRFNEGEFRSQMDALVATLKASCPDAALLLTTPQECYKRSYTRRGRGRKRRRVRSYSINSNIARARDVITDYCALNSIAVYDWFAVAGGVGSASKWLGDKLMNTDRIHLTWDGYHLMGDLLGESLLNSFDDGHSTKD